jgi:hypothetical protein
VLADEAGELADKVDAVAISEDLQTLAKLLQEAEEEVLAGMPEWTLSEYRGPSPSLPRREL